ncbi:MAG: NUDIX hydrolase [Nanoarchaeota archaeon]|nr:NUDIX hydrolase [Nanoarchaeota archaeon]MBU1052066.1 NUDIX hydrolase [Nanoarchaeota archaeon]MBU1988706.1 NUDIX hydrolase [Nanoarchaeota archaeon]
MGEVHPAVKAVVLDGNRFLVLETVIGEKRVWDLPGGRVKHGESPYGALNREIKEETGLKVDIVDSLGVYWYLRVTDGKQIVCNAFSCKPKSLDVSLPPNGVFIKSSKWVTKEEFLSNDFVVDNESLKELISEKVT